MVAKGTRLISLHSLCGGGEQLLDLNRISSLYLKQDDRFYSVSLARLWCDDCDNVDWRRHDDVMFNGEFAVFDWRMRLALLPKL